MNRRRNPRTERKREQDNEDSGQQEMADGCPAASDHSSPNQSQCSLELKFTPDQLGAGAGDPATDVPSLFVAIQEQLGLKLEAQRAPVDVLVIDSAQRAVEN